MRLVRVIPAAVLPKFHLPYSGNMCGIAGFISREKLAFDRTEVLRSMTDQLAHRGPDDVGHWTGAEGVSLGHRRLSIVDLSCAGHQPMESASRRYYTVFNGELYNFREIRRELASKGVSFRSDSDTEVALSAFDVWGVQEAVRRFVGMFAFAIWDSQERVLHLVRDRVGEKPLYYGRMNGDLVFASELKSLQKYPSWSGEIDKEALAVYFRLGYVTGRQTIYRDVKRVMPGTIVSVKRTGEPVVHTYWSAGDAARNGVRDPLPEDPKIVGDAIDAALRVSVRDQMLADVPLGAFLSGGIDSSLIVALMQAESSLPVKTFTIGFDDENYNEAVFARDVARHLGTQHTEFFVTGAEAREVIPRLPQLYDEPFADSSQIPTHLVSALARRHVTVSLSGDGGDELFGGYSRYLEAARLLSLTRPVPRPVRYVGGRLLRQLPGGLTNWLSSLARADRSGLIGRINPSPERIARLADVLEARDADEIYRAMLSHWTNPAALVGGGVSGIPSVDIGDESRLGPLERLMLRDLVSYLPDDILVKVDRAAMGVSLESRAPFLDYRVVELAWRIPLSLKIRDGSGKWILRELLARYVPRAMFERPKRGFGVPLGEWLRGPLRDWAEDLLDARSLKADGLIDPKPVLSKWQEHKAGHRNWQYLLWDVLMFQAWRAENGRREKRSLPPAAA